MSYLRYKRMINNTYCIRKINNTSRIECVITDVIGTINAFADYDVYVSIALPKMRTKMTRHLLSSETDIIARVAT